MHKMWWDMLWPYGWPVGLCFSLTVLWTIVLLRLAPVWGLVSHPGGRRIHEVPTPSVGGIAVILGCAPAAALLLPIDPPLVALGLAMALLLGVGIVDDRFEVKWRYRIAAQALAGMVLFYVGGVRVESIGSALGFPEHTLGLLSAPFTVLATVGLINAFNMADGIDGLAGSLALAALTMLAAAAVYAGNGSLALELAFAIAAVAGFLVFNLRTPWNPRAKVFLGSGSEILGLIIAWGSFRLTQTPSHPVTPVLAPFLFAPPLIDCLVLIVRRIRSGRSAVAADRSHFHHLLLHAGLSTSQVVATITGASLAIGMTAALARRVHVPEPLFIVAFLGLCSAYFVWSVRRDRRSGEWFEHKASAPQLVTGELPEAWAESADTATKPVYEAAE